MAIFFSLKGNYEACKPGSSVRREETLAAQNWALFFPVITAVRKLGSLCAEENQILSRKFKPHIRNGREVTSCPRCLHSKTVRIYTTQLCVTTQYTIKGTLSSAVVKSEAVTASQIMTVTFLLVLKLRLTSLVFLCEYVETSLVLVVYDMTHAQRCQWSTGHCYLRYWNKLLKLLLIQ